MAATVYLHRGARVPAEDYQICDFEDGLCDWDLRSLSSLKWVRTSQTSISSSLEPLVGPGRDHSNNTAAGWTASSEPALWTLLCLCVFTAVLLTVATIKKVLGLFQVTSCMSLYRRVVSRRTGPLSKAPDWSPPTARTPARSAWRSFMPNLHFGIDCDKEKEVLLSSVITLTSLVEYESTIFF